MPLDLSTTEKRLAVAASFKDLIVTPGWKNYEIIMKENIEVVKKQILTGTGDQIKDDKLRDKLAVHEEALNKVYEMIEKLAPQSPNEPPEFDPFEESA